ncbi:HNH endonuclease signature motif containing protein [Myceligenerans pegani]|uniref:HNH endonuclease n=1 Tax=Myceligenerans pegani TaxID=2776917 RepID=A0ABR9N2E1_9MICO|nr:HNH endonuclease signature motif containing protein [Myceligenerans sp. TRM 65318]MBE1877816.1 HNH endonuclease [Myceligenerans sp. TRM 65318]MBE3020087.1 HNH endonuclease [Myceligenerans sp. TRM 65318]
MQGPMFDDAELVDEFGVPVPAPDHTARELAAILATNPLNDPTFAAELAARDAGPDGLPGEVVNPADLLLGDVAGLAPDAALAGALRDLTRTPEHLDTVSDSELRGVVAGWERLISWARAGQARVARELMARTDGPLGRDSVAGEIAGELRVTTGEAWGIAMRGEGTGLYPDLEGALSAGRIDARKADTFLRAGADLTTEERREAITELLPDAPEHTWKWISERMNAWAARLHGKKARRRQVVDRSDVWAESAGPGVGRIIADLPVADAAQAFNTVQGAAKALKDAPGETRPLGALRAAAFAALITGRVVLACPDGDGENGSDEGDATEELPGLVAPVLDTDLVPVPEDPPGIHLTAPAPEPGTTDPAHPAGTRIRVVDVPATVHVTVPATMLLDPDDLTPGNLEGIGPIPADAAARIAADGTWRRLLTDPASGVLTDYSTRAYTPGATLRAAVTARDETCTFPGCHRPARSGGRTTVDLDHIQPFDPDHPDRPGTPGQTRAANLHALCRKHHNLKTHGGWHVTRDPGTGVTRWTAPTGARTDVRPTITDPAIRYALTRGMTLAAPPAPPTADGPTPTTPDTGAPPF